MPGKRVTQQQEIIYMSERSKGRIQAVSAAKAGFSERTGRSVEKRQPSKSPPPQRHWRTRQNPFEGVWENELVPMLEAQPELQPITLLEHLQITYPDDFPDSLLRTLQRHVKTWKAIHGPEKEEMFRQNHPPGRLGLSDFTTLKGVTVSIQGVALQHLLYHFRLACSGWSHLKVVLGGESFTALAEGLQEALWRLGGVPDEHRTDSLSAAFKNLTQDEQQDITERYQQLCQDYQMTPTRNNRGESHENGSIEASHGHMKRRIKQGLLLRGSSDFESIEAYQAWLDGIVCQHNRRNAKSVTVERAHLKALPVTKSVDYTELNARVSCASTIDVRRTTYTVPSRLQGECLRIHLYHDRLVCYLGMAHVITLARVYSIGKTTRARQVDYRHVIHSLVKKPAAFRFSQLRDDLLPNDNYQRIWRYVEKHKPGKASCHYIVQCLYLAATQQCERELAQAVLASIERGSLLSLGQLTQRFGKPSLQAPPVIAVEQHDLSAYDALLPPATREANHA